MKNNTTDTAQLARDLEKLAGLRKIRVVPDMRFGCLNLYWPDGSHAFAVGARDAIETITFNGRAGC